MQQRLGVVLSKIIRRPSLISKILRSCKKSSMVLNMMRETEIYRCVLCHGSLIGLNTEYLACCACHARYPIQYNILDTLIKPLPDAQRELQGMAIESGRSAEDWQSVRIQCLESVSTFAERLRLSATHSDQYYQQTQRNFEQAIQSIENIHLNRVLEIGSETDYFFLSHFRTHARCHAVNLFFQRQESDAFLDWPEKTLGDMNQLPFQNGSFELVLFSATLHHSSNVEGTLREVARVLRPRGVALVLSEQIGGLLKRSGRDRHRNELIHETYHPFWKYHAGFERAGFQPSYLFSRYFDEKLAAADIHPYRRFARLGRVAAALWRVPGFRWLVRGPLLRPAHILFGFPLNAILRKKA
jgi:SAM-dependent methyltransferase